MLSLSVKRLDEEKNRAFQPKDIPPGSDPAVLADLERILPRSNLEAQLTAFVAWYGAAEVKRIIAKITTGAPKKLDDKFHTWMAVELFRFRTPGATTLAACQALTKHAKTPKMRFAAAKTIGKDKRKLVHVVPANSGTIRRIHSEINARFKKERHLRAAWQWQLNCVCGRQTTQEDWRRVTKEARVR